MIDTSLRATARRDYFISYSPPFGGERNMFLNYEELSRVNKEGMQHSCGKELLETIVNESNTV